MDKYLKMFKPAMTKWLRDHYPLEEAKKRWKKTVYLDGKWIRLHWRMSDQSKQNRGEC